MQQLGGPKQQLGGPMQQLGGRMQTSVCCSGQWCDSPDMELEAAPDVVLSGA